MVRVIVRPWRTCREVNPAALTRLQLARLMLSSAGHLPKAEQGAFENFLRVNPLLGRGYALKTRFHTLLAKRDLPALEPWLQAAETAELSSFQAVARSFRQDIDAIHASLTTPWSMGPCEGQICRVQLIKRLGYGCAKIDLLRQRILHQVTGLVRRVNQHREVKSPLAA